MKTRYELLVERLEELQREWIVSAHALKSIPAKTSWERSAAVHQVSAMERCIVELDEILKVQDYAS